MCSTPAKQHSFLAELAGGGRSGRALTGVELTRERSFRGTHRAPAPAVFSPLSGRGKRATRPPAPPVVDLSGQEANVLEGFRLVDVHLLSEFVQHKVACKDCVRDIIQAQLASFVASMKAGGSFSTGTGLDRALESYDIPASRRLA